VILPADEQMFQRGFQKPLFVIEYSRRVKDIESRDHFPGEVVLFSASQPNSTDREITCSISCSSAILSTHSSFIESPQIKSPTSQTAELRTRAGIFTEFPAHSPARMLIPVSLVVFIILT
jgi:hypothetical protein